MPDQTSTHVPSGINTVRVLDSAEKLDAVPTEWLTTADGNHNGLDATYFEGKFGEPLS